MSVSVISMASAAYPSPAGSLLIHNKLPSMTTMMDSLEVVLEEEKTDKESETLREQGLEFHDHHGRNIELKNGNRYIRFSNFSCRFINPNNFSLFVL